MKSAVLYYSRAQKTTVTAKAIADKVSGDLIEIKDMKSRNGIIGWIRAALDARGEKTTEIEPSTFDLSSYDAIFIGTPIWAGKATPAINTVISHFDLKDKDITLFVTLGGSNYKNALNFMKNKVESTGGIVKNTFAIVNSGKKSEEDIKKDIDTFII